jgi:uncharacterized GH25 family protein
MKKLTMKFPIFSAVAFAALLSSTEAHDTWLLPDKFEVTPGTTVTLDLTSGMAFPKLESGPKPERVQEAKCRLAGQIIEVTQRIAAPNSLQLKGELAQAGVATLWVKLPSRTIDLTPDEVEHYLEEVSAPESLRKQWTEMKEPRRWRESYTKHQKTFVRVGDPMADGSWSEPVGTFLEIVPEADPTSVKPGDDFPVRVLKNGSPLAAFALNAVGAAEEKGETKKTDAEGRARFRLNKEGPWLLRGTDIRKATGGDADWESDFVTLTLEVKKK